MLFLALGVTALFALGYAFAHTSKIQTSLLNKEVPHYITKAITAFVVIAHFSELQRAVHEISMVNIFATIGLFVIWVAARSGNASEL